MKYIIRKLYYYMRYKSARLMSLLYTQNFVNKIDLARFNEIRVKYETLSKTPKRKYFNLHYWINLNLGYVFFLGLEKRGGEAILDIGTGFGYFPFLCKTLGHAVQTIDVGLLPVYDEMINFFGLSRLIYKVNPSERIIDTTQEYDLVTALMVSFANHNKNTAWGVTEWNYFLQDIKTHQLKQSGRIFMTLNPGIDGLYNRELQTFFECKGAILFSNIVYFPDLKFI